MTTGSGDGQGPGPPRVRHSEVGTAALLEAVAAISSDLDLSEVLSRIVRSACSLVGARYGALGVLHPDGEHLAQFITHGLSADERGAIGDLPQGHGILGLLIREPAPKRLSEIAEHPQSYGFPPHHPPMHTFLGAPVRIREEVFGNLYLTEKLDAAQFTAEDESLLTALAATAGVAIENARLYTSSKNLRAWSDALAQLTQTLLAGPQEQPALEHMVALAVQRAHAALAFVVLYDEEGALVVRASHAPANHRGRDGDARHAKPLGVGSRIAAPGWRGVGGRRIGDLVVWRDHRPAGADAVQPGIDQLAGHEVSSAYAILPLGPEKDLLGFLVVIWETDDAPSQIDVIRPLLVFGQHAGVALLAARSQRAHTMIALLEDRDRIARDMHDHVIQRLFATGLSLQSAARLSVHPTVRERLDDAVDDLDGAIKDIRHTIYELHRLPVGTIRDQIGELLDTAAGTLGFEPDLIIEGQLASLTAGLVADLLAVVREGLANVAKHAQATEVRVHVQAGASMAVIVVDNGIGMDPADARSGVVNLGARAAARGGTLELTSAAPSGSILTWTVPAERD